MLIGRCLPYGLFNVSNVALVTVLDGRGRIQISPPRSSRTPNHDPLSIQRYHHPETAHLRDKCFASYKTQCEC